MIRQARVEDTERIIELMYHYRDQSPLTCLKSSGEDTFRRILALIFEKNYGIVLAADDGEKIVGMLIAIKNFNIWDTTKACMNELAWWVEPEHRGGSHAYRLMKKYQEIGDYMIGQKEIEYYTISKMVNSPDLDYAKFGFQKLEETWSCRQV
jgi:hypothetical protein